MERWLITGAGRGIGFEFTRALLERGDGVAAAARSEEGLQRLTAHFEQHRAGRLSVLKFDVSKVQESEAVSRSFTAEIDVLVCNAGILGPLSPTPLDVDCKAFIETLTTNTVGPLLTVQTFLQNLRSSKRPRIAVITSRMGSFAYERPADLVPYQASKAAANKVARGLSEALRAEGISVVALHPGLVATELAGSRANAGAIPIEDSVSGMLDVIDRLTIEHTGKFLDYRGRPCSW